jgi:DNA-binding LytR/AlgR family response regulator
MKGIESRLPRKNFIRVHRSYIINLDKVASLEDNALVINEKSIPIGASYKEGLMKKLNLL